MTALDAVHTAIAGFGYPAVPCLYEGKEKKYFTYNYSGNHGADFGDDAPGCDLAEVQVHFFMPIVDEKKRENYTLIRNEIRKALFGNGFTYPSVEVIEEHDTNTWHLVFECEYEEEI